MRRSFPTDPIRCSSKCGWIKAREREMVLRVCKLGDEDDSSLFAFPVPGFFNPG